jgi:hypothetical protein
MEQSITDSKIQKWGGVASFFLAVTFFVPGLIYLIGDLRSTLGQYAYHLADFLYGPVWSVCLVMVVFTFREKFISHAPRRMSLALMSAFLSAGAMIAVAFIRSSNRQYHILHPELNLQESIPVLVVWTTLIAGLTAVGWHFLGWTQILIGSAGWESQQLPRLLNLLYFAMGVVSLFVYLFPAAEGLGILLGMVISIWQGVLFLKAKSNE